MGARSPGWYGVVDGLVKWSSPGIDSKTLSLAGFSTGSWFGEATMLRAAPMQSGRPAAEPRGDPAARYLRTAVEPQYRVHRRS